MPIRYTEVCCRVVGLLSARGNKENIRAWRAWSRRALCVAQVFGMRPYGLAK
jgi:hypothetical protein